MYNENESHAFARTKRNYSEEWRIDIQIIASGPVLDCDDDDNTKNFRSSRPSVVFHHGGCLREIVNAHTEPGTKARKMAIRMQHGAGHTQIRNRTTLEPVCGMGWYVCERERGLPEYE